MFFQGSSKFNKNKEILGIPVEHTMESAKKQDHIASDHPKEIRISKRSVDEFEARTHSETHNEGQRSSELTDSWSSANLSFLKSVLGIDSSDIIGEKKEEHAHSGNSENWGTMGYNQSGKISRAVGEIAHPGTLPPIVFATDNEWTTTPSKIRSSPYPGKVCPPLM
ncbi:hypothetical protein TNCV_554301 [Trichonephila clavipes]|nr:hypothetical protein TNCV_554301 [Trichonephila clavipes]